MQSASNSRLITAKIMYYCARCSVTHFLAPRPDEFQVFTQPGFAHPQPALGVASLHPDEASRAHAAGTMSAATACGCTTSTAIAISTRSVPGGSIFSDMPIRESMPHWADQLGRLEHVILAGFTHETSRAVIRAFVGTDRAVALFLRQRRCVRRRDRPEDELPLLEECRTA